MRGVDICSAMVGDVFEGVGDAVVVVVVVVVVVCLQGSESWCSGDVTGSLTWTTLANRRSSSVCLCFVVL